MNDKPERDNPRTDPLFDGHLEWPVERMTPDQRLQWLDEALMLLHEGRRARERARAEKDRQARRP